MSYQFTSIQEMIDCYYGGKDVAKADAPVLTTTTGVLNVIFGAKVFYQLNAEANAWALLPKYPWQYSGWRAITADPTSINNGSVAETSALPDTIQPTFKEITVPTRAHEHNFDVSAIQEGKVKKGDDAVGDMEFLRGYFAVFHAKDINTSLLRDVDSLAANRFDSIDRVCSSKSEEDALLTAGDADIYGIDRSDSGNSWADATVDHNSGTDRVLTDELIRDTLATIKGKGGRTNLILTGTDTESRVMGLYNNQVRYPGVLTRDVLSQIGVNGVQTEEGGNFGIRVSAVYSIPMFTSQNVVQDTISRMYFLDTTEQEASGVPRLGIALMYPTLYFESGFSAANPNPFAINKMATEGMYYTAGNLVCNFFAAQGKIRDLK